METVTASVNDTARSLGLGRTKVYELINDGKLATIKIGRRTLVKAESIRALVEAA
jgi:excisionase family DNA binding protein